MTKVELVKLILYILCYESSERLSLENCNILALWNGGEGKGSGPEMIVDVEMISFPVSITGGYSSPLVS